VLFLSANLTRNESAVWASLDDSITYPNKIPFNPPKNYPEKPFDCGVDETNKVYAAIRKIFELMNLDRFNRNTSEWSPLSEVIKKGDKVMIKPNLVLDRNLSGGSVFAVVTHPAIIRTVVDYAYKAIGDGGKIVIADAPQNDANFEKLVETTGLRATVEYLKSNFSVPLELCDLRREKVVHKNGAIVERHILSGDPKGYACVDLGKKSNLEEFGSNYKNFYGADYDRRKTVSFHREGHHVYSVSKTALESDVIINLPKLKTHMKAGVTISLKNMIGIIGEKSSIPHYRVGPPSRGGDEYPEQISIFKAFSLKFNRVYSDYLLSRGLGANLYGNLFKLCGGNRKFANESGGSGFVHSGNWCRNDTIWRSVLDINKIAIFADKNGQIQETPQRKMFILVDGIIGGEGQGPLAPRAKRSGTVICGTDPIYVDRVGARLMGFNEARIPLLARFARSSLSDHINIVLLEKDNAKVVNFHDLSNLHFKPPYGWNN